MGDKNATPEEVLEILKSEMKTDYQLELKKTADEIKQEMAEFRKSHSNGRTNEEIDKEFNLKMDEMEAKYASINTKIEEQASFREKLEKMEGQIDNIEANSARMKVKDEEKATQSRYKKDAFKFLLNNAQKKFNENDKLESIKSLRSNVAEQGGLVLREREAMMLTQLPNISDFLNNVGMITGEEKFFPVIISMVNSNTAGVGEKGTTGNFPGNNFKSENLLLNKITSAQSATYEMIDLATKIDVESFIESNARMDFAAKLATMITTGTGVKEPMGIMTDTLVNTINSIKTDEFSVTDISALIEQIQAAGPQYDAGSKFMFNYNTLHKLRLTQNGIGDYLYLNHLSDAVPSTLMGYQFITNNNMDNIATGKHPIILGNFSRYFLLYRKPAVTLSIDENQADGYYTFFFRSYADSRVINDKAFYKLKMA